ncbi:hypothetical protein Goshw_011035, partial [Gossypium schwendimanii]|nr:hypothetical protein [Gossypium schwendimanii]
DFQVWSAEASGKYTVRSAYKLLQGIEEDPRAYTLQDDYKDFYKKLWLLDLPSKIKITMWKLSWNFLATRANMLLKKPTNTTACPRAQHHSVRLFVVHYGLSGETGMLESQVFITVNKWRKPPNRVVKINFDVAYDGRQNRSAVGIMARDREGTVVLSCSEVHHRIISAFATEALACRKALQIGIDMQWENIIIEGDSLSIIRKCKTKSPDKPLVSAYIHDIHQQLLNLKDCKFEHVPRSANGLTHILANETLKRNIGVYLVGSVPEGAEKQAESERARGPD